MPGPNRNESLALWVADASDEDILADVNGHIYGPVDGFYEKHFITLKSFCGEADAVQKLAGAAGDSYYACLSSAPSSHGFLQWFSAFSRYAPHTLDDSQGAWHTVRLEAACGATDSHGHSAHLYLTRSLATFDPLVNDTWTEVEVIGEFRDSPSADYREGFVALCRQANQVFLAQPERLFLHGFYTRGSLMELWAFDRSGLYCSEVFDIQEQFGLFLSVMFTYSRMSAAEVGRFSPIRYDGPDAYIPLEEENVISPSLRHKLYIENQPFARSDRLVGAGTTVYRGKATKESPSWEYVVKFKWRSAASRPEEEILKLAMAKNVRGLLSVHYHRDNMESTASLRAGLEWTQPGRKMVQEAKQRTTESESERESATAPNGILRYTRQTNRYFRNRILTCVVLSSIGRPLGTFKTPRTLVKVLSDVAKAHRSLLQDAGILHQDISPGNIIITGGDGDGGGPGDSDDGSERGILIDLDVAMELSVGPRNAGEIVGTRMFMAIGVLQGKLHTYRHDLESLLYVFLWVVLCKESECLPEQSRLRRWTQGGFKAIAKCKMSDMEESNFEGILEEFDTGFEGLKPVARSLREVLFGKGVDGGQIWTETDMSPEGVNSMYDRVIGIFEDSVLNL